MSKKPLEKFKLVLEEANSNLSLAFSDNQYVPLSVISQTLGPLANNTAELSDEEGWIVLGWAVLSVFGHCVDHLLSETLPLSDGITYWNEVFHSGPMGLALFTVQSLPAWIVKQARNHHDDGNDTHSGLSSFKLFLKLQPKSYNEIIYMVNPAYAAIKRHVKSRRQRAVDLRNEVAETLGHLVQDSFVIDQGATDKNELIRKTSADTIRALTRCLQCGPPERVVETFVPSAAEALYDVIEALKHESGESRYKEELKFCGKPSRLVRYWPAGVIGVYGLYKFLGNLPALINWVQTQVFDTAKLFWENWIVQPFKNIYETVRHDDQARIALMSRQSLDSDMSSLERMVIQFAHDYGGPDTANLPEELLREKVQNGDMSAVMIPYEKQIQAPISSLLKGQLFRSLLIQIQKTKVDVEVAMDGIDKLLQSQQLVFGLVAALPAITVVWFAGRNLINRSQQGKLQKQARGRGELRERALLSLSEIEHVIMTTTNNAMKLGLVLCETHLLRSLGRNLLSTARFEQFSRDLEAVENETNHERQLNALDRIYIHGYFK